MFLLWLHYIHKDVKNRYTNYNMDHNCDINQDEYY